MTTEVTSDPEYLSAVYHKMRIRTALIGVESFSEAGLKGAGKRWNPAGQKMVETIQNIQASGILVLSSIICGLESDTTQTIRTMSKFTQDSGALFAQFTIYNPYPGTKDFYEMMDDRKNLGKSNFVPKHETQILHDQYWLKSLKPVDIIRRPHISRQDLFAENKQCREIFYSLKESRRRTKGGVIKTWPLAGKITYLLVCQVFKRAYAGYGMAADSVRQKNMGLFTKMLIKAAVGIYNHFYLTKRFAVRLRLTRSG